MTEALVSKTCTPCRGGIPPAWTREEAELFGGRMLDWRLAEEAHRIERSFRFRDFREALTFVQEIRRARGSRRPSLYPRFEGQCADLNTARAIRPERRAPSAHSWQGGSVFKRTWRNGWRGTRQVAGISHLGPVGHPGRPR